MALKPISLGEIIEVILPSEKSSEDPTVFKIGVLDSIVRSKIEDISMVYRYNPDAPKDSLMESKLDIATQELEYVRFGLKGFKNFKDKNNKDIPLLFIKKKIGDTEYDVVSDETLKYIPRFALKELSEIIRKENKESEAEAKN